MRGEMWPRRQETIPPDVGPPRCAQLMGLASRGCLVLVLGAIGERRNLLFWSDLGLPWVPCLKCTPLVQVKQRQNEWAERSTGHFADQHQFLFAPTLGRIAQHRRRYRPTATSRSKRVWPFPVERDPGHYGSSSKKTWAQRRHPWCSRRWVAWQKPEGAQPADTRRGGG